MNRSERVAKIAVEELVPGASMRYRPDQSESTHDFDLLLPNDSLVPLEVTESNDPVQRETVAAIRRAPWVPATVCRRTWMVHPMPAARIKRIRREIDGYLAHIEAQDCSQFFAPFDAAESPSIERIYRELGIEGGSSFDGSEQPKIYLSPPGGGGLVDPAEVDAAILAEAAKADNRRKLALAGSDERHLFVFIHHEHSLPWITINSSRPPSSIPNLPEEVTHVWASALSYDSKHVVTWKASHDSAWSHAGYVHVSDEIWQG